MFDPKIRVREMRRNMPVEVIESSMILGAFVSRQLTRGRCRV